MIIDIIAPGYGSKKEDIAAAERVVKKLGFIPRIPKDIFKAHPLHSHEDDYRLEHLIKALTAKDSQAIWCFKGGYGTAKLIPMLAKLKKPAKPKMLIGFSDITALHLFLNQKWGWPTLHAPVLWQLIHGKVDASSAEKVKAFLLGKHAPKFALKPMNEAAKNYSGSGKIIGGNLALLQTSIGTMWQAKPKGKFLFIEEVDEHAYRVDRMLNHLKQAGLFTEVKGVLLGDFTYKTLPDEVKKIDALLKEGAVDFPAPVFRLAGIGHGDINDPLVLGAKADIRKNMLTL